MVVGILGGSGLYALEGVGGLRSSAVTTPFGDPSAPPLCGRIGACDVVFLPRHGQGHRFIPSEINYRANVYALKQLGVERVISVSAVGSMREAIHPGDVVVVDQFIDRTHGRATTFFGGGVAGHVAFAEPVCPPLSATLFGAALAAGFGDASAGVVRTERDASACAHRGGTYVNMEGPQFSTRAESMLHRAWGVDVVGMTAATEAKLCREAEMCFSVLALATDYDCWHPDEDAVTAGGVVATLRRTIERARAVLTVALGSLPADRNCSCGNAAKDAVMTDRAVVPEETKKRLAALFGRYL